MGPILSKLDVEVKDFVELNALFRYSGNLATLQERDIASGVVSDLQFPPGRPEGYAFGFAEMMVLAQREIGATETQAPRRTESKKWFQAILGQVAIPQDFVEQAGTDRLARVRRHDGCAAIRVP
jgi:hypothetical protein